MKENFVFEYKIFLHYTGHSKDMSMGFQPFLSFVGLKSSKIYCNILRPFDKHVDFTGLHRQTDWVLQIDWQTYVALFGTWSWFCIRALVMRPPAHWTCSFLELLLTSVEEMIKNKKVKLSSTSLGLLSYSLVFRCDKPVNHIPIAMSRNRTFCFLYQCYWKSCLCLFASANRGGGGRYSRYSYFSWNDYCFHVRFPSLSAESITYMFGMGACIFHSLFAPNHSKLFSLNFYLIYLNSMAPMA